MSKENNYGITKEELERIAELAGIEFVWKDFNANTNKVLFDGDGKKYVLSDKGNINNNETMLDSDIDVAYTGEELKTLLKEMADAAYSPLENEFCYFVQENIKRIRKMANIYPEVSEVLVLGYKVGIAQGNGNCMNDLGALYYMGDFVEQDYAKAAELYELAADAGCFQSIINLGYIYEYGRIGKPDHTKAYQWYSLAAALNKSCEATYKLGDMYSRGKAVPKDMKKAYWLYERSLDLACGKAEYAQPAIRIAKMLIDKDASSYGVDLDPMRALYLYQAAEIGLRIDIENGQTYYAKRLEEAIEGQQKARALVEARNEIVSFD